MQTTDLRYFINNWFKTLSCILLCLTMCGCEMYAVIDADSPIIVDRVVSDSVYRCNYSSDGSRFYMQLTTIDHLAVGDTLYISKLIETPLK